MQGARGSARPARITSVDAFRGLLMTLVPVPGRGAPDLDAKDGHLAAWVDHAVLGSHMWYGGDKGYDPEGILSTIPALATTLFGVFAALMLTFPARLFAGGALLTAAGYAWGVNAITVFVGSGVLARTLIYVEIGGSSLQSIVYESLFASWLPPYAASLAYAVAWVAGWFAVVAWMDRRGWVVKV